MTSALCFLASALCPSAWANSTNLPAPSGYSVSVDSNGVIIAPTNFFPANRIPLNTEVLTNVEERILNIVEASIDVEVPAALEAYYLKTQSDVRYLMRDSYVYGEQVRATGTWSRLSGNTLEELLSSIDSQIGQGGGTGSFTNVSNVYNTTTGTTNASGVGVSFAPQSYTPSAATVQEHLRAIDSRLQYLATYLSTSGIPVSTQTLVSVAVTGPNTAAEGVDELYVLTATLSDATTTNVTASPFAQWTVTGSAAAAMITNRLHVGPIYSNVTVAVRGIYSLGGIVKDNAKNVLIIDTNAPVLSAVYVIGPTAVNERATAAYRAWAVFDSGTSNDVSETATWGGTAGSVTAGSLTAVEVSSTTMAVVTAQYAWDSTILTGSNTVVVTSVDQKLAMTFNYSGVYASGTLHIDCWANSRMQNFPLKSWTMSGFSIPGTHTITNTLTTPYQGNTYWFAWVDTDGNNMLNGAMTASGPAVRTDEPGAIASVMPVALLNNSDAAITFNLTDMAPGCHFRQGWLSTDLGGAPRAIFTIYNRSGPKTRILESVPLTNRTYFCEWDAMVGNISLGSANGAFPSGLWIPDHRIAVELRLYKGNVDGSIDPYTSIYGMNPIWP